MPTPLKIILGVIASIAALTMVGLALPEVEDDEPAAPAATNIDEQITTAPLPTSMLTHDPEPEPEPTTEEPEPEPRSTTGDYDTNSAYIDTMAHSTEKVSELLNLVGEAANMTADGRMQGDDFGRIMVQASDTIRSHIAFFRDRTPPDRFRTVEALMLEAWRTFDEAFAAGEICGRQQDQAACNRAADLMDEGSALTDEATAAMQDSRF